MGVGDGPRVALRSNLVADGVSGANPVVASDGSVEQLAKPRLRGVSHEIAAFVFPVMGVVAVLVARSPADRAAVAVYAVGVSALYATSACYHRVNWAPSSRRRMRRLDNSMILVAIASTYTPIAVVGLPPTTAGVLLGVVWGLAVAGMLVRNLWLSAPSWVMGAFYIGVGWTAVAVLPGLWAGLGAAAFSLLVAGGLVYSAGALVLLRHWPDPVPAVFGYHEVFHALVLLAGLLFYIVVILVVTRG
jgi:hemolysin III